MNFKNQMDFDRATFFMAGLIIGNHLHTVTTTILLFIWVIISNKPLPYCLGGALPQDMLAFIVNYISNVIGKFIPPINIPNKEKTTQMNNQDIQNDYKESHKEGSISPSRLITVPPSREEVKSTAMPMLGKSFLRSGPNSVPVLSPITNESALVYPYRNKVQSVYIIQPRR